MKLESTLSKSSKVSPGASLRQCMYSHSHCYDRRPEHVGKNMPWNAGSSRKSVNSYQPTPCYIPEDGRLHGCCCENIEFQQIQLSSIRDKWTGRTEKDTVFKMMFFQNVATHIQVNTKVSEEPPASTRHSFRKLRRQVRLKRWYSFTVLLVMSSQKTLWL